MNSSRSRHRFGWRTNIGLLFCSTLGAILLCELALLPFSRFQPYPPYDVGEHENRFPKGFIVDPLLGWRLNPKADSINAQGFRGEIDFDASRSQKKIVLVGDSFTFGAGVELKDTFGALIDAELPNTVVYNLGVPGYGVDQVWLTLRHVALPLDPDLIVVGLCDADFKRSQSAYRPTEGLNKPAFKLDGGRLIRKTESDRSKQPIHFLERYSRVWEAGRLAVQWLGYRYPLGEWWNLNEALIDEMRSDADENETSLLFVRIPTVEWRNFPTLDNYMDRVEAEYINLRSGAPLDPKSLYLIEDIYPHLNKRGHRYVADRILAWLRGGRITD